MTRIARMCAAPKPGSIAAAPIGCANAGTIHTRLSLPSSYERCSVHSYDCGMPCCELDRAIEAPGDDRARVQAQAATELTNGSGTSLLTASAADPTALAASTTTRARTWTHATGPPRSPPPSGGAHEGRARRRERPSRARFVEDAHDLHVRVDRRARGVRLRDEHLQRRFAWRRTRTRARRSRSADSRRGCA